MSYSLGPRKWGAFVEETPSLYGGSSDAQRGGGGGFCEAPGGGSPRSGGAWGQRAAAAASASPCDADEMLDAECLALLAPAQGEARPPSSPSRRRSPADSPMCSDEGAESCCSPVQQELLAARASLDEQQRARVRSIRRDFAPHLFGNLLAAYHSFAAERVPAVALAVWEIAAAVFREALAVAPGDEAYAREVALALARSVAGHTALGAHGARGGAALLPAPAGAWSSAKVTASFSLRLANEQGRLLALADAAAKAAARSFDSASTAAAGGSPAAHSAARTPPVRRGSSTSPSQRRARSPAGPLSPGLRYDPFRCSPPSARLSGSDLELPPFYDDGDDGMIGLMGEGLPSPAPPTRSPSPTWAAAALVPALTPSQRLPAVDLLRASAALAESQDAMRSPGAVGLPPCLSARAQPGSIAARTLRGPLGALSPALVLVSSARGAEPASALRLRQLRAASSAQLQDGHLRVAGRARPRPATFAVHSLAGFGESGLGALSRGVLNVLQADEDDAREGDRAATAEAERSRAQRHARAERAPVSMRASFLYDGGVASLGPSPPAVGAAAAAALSLSLLQPPPPTSLSASLQPRSAHAAGRAVCASALAHAQLARLFAVTAGDYGVKA